ncbi:MAG TPA: PIN domain-containing protein [Gemmatimonadales bacterium]|nr:PIN domain-containing protein [Gemmatimonadales bacterium]
MTLRVFVDTDVILDLVLARPDFLPEASRLFALIQNGQIEACTSPLVLSNLFYILTKKISAEEAIKALRKLRALLRVLPIDERMIDMALASSFNDFEDAVQYYAAVSADLDALVTRNKKDYGSAEIPILTAAECVASYHSTRD